MLNKKMLVKKLLSLKNRWTLFWCLLVLFAILGRVYKIESLPPVVSHDEVFYLNQARSVSLTGSDQSGEWRPWSLTVAHPLFAELPGVLMSLGFLVTAVWPLSAKLVSIMAGVLMIVVLSAVALKLFSNRVIAISVALAATFNPWLFQFSRSGFDPLLSLLCYFSGIWIFLRTKGWWKLLTLLPLSLGFYQYQGHKVVFLPIIILLITYDYLESRQLSKKISWHSVFTWVVFFCSGFVMVAFFLLNLKNQKASSRLGDFIFSDMSRVQALVNEDRQLTLDVPWLSTVSNKYTYLTKEFIAKYVESFDLRLFFVSGEPVRNPFSVWSLGFFHTVDLVFIVIGFGVLWKKKEYRLAAILITGLLLTAPLPVALSRRDTWIAFRASLLIPTYVLLAGVGLGTVWSSSKWWLRSSIIIVYFIFVSRFSFEYFFRLPIIGTRGTYFAERVVANYYLRLPRTQKLIVLADESRFVFEEILYFSQSINSENMSQIQQAVKSEKYLLNNLRVDTACLKPEMFDGQTTVIADANIGWCESTPLDYDKKSLVTRAIPSLLDSGAIFRIYNDTLCAQHNLDRFSHVRQDNFNLESLTPKVLCESFVTHEQ